MMKYERLELTRFVFLWAMTIGTMSAVGVAMGTDLSVGMIGVFVALGFGLLLARSAPSLFLPIVVATVVRSILGIFQAVSMALPDGAADALKFHRDGTNASALPFSQWLADIPTGSTLYGHLLGLLYTPLGPNLLLGISLNIVLGVLIVYVIGRAAGLIWGKNVSRRTAWICALFPTLVLYSVILLRENFIILGLSASVLFAIIAVQRLSIFLAVASTVIAYGSGIFNNAVWAALPVTVVLFVWLILMKIIQRFDIRMSPNSKVIGLTILAVSGLAVVYIGLEMTGWINRGFDGILYAMEARTSGRTAYPDALVPDRPIDLIWAFPLRILFFLLAPFPWMIARPIDLIGLTDMLIYVVILTGLWTSRKKLMDAPVALWVGLFAIAMIAAFALATSNVGTAVRHRAKLLPMLLVLVPLIPFHARIDELIQAIESRIDEFRASYSRRSADSDTAREEHGRLARRNSPVIGDGGWEDFRRFSALEIHPPEHRNHEGHHYVLAKTPIEAGDSRS